MTEHRRSARSRSALAAVLAASLLLVAGAAVASANAIPHPGPQLNLFTPPATMPADTAFWIGHGGSTIPDELPAAATPGSFRFELSVDGSDVTLRKDLEFTGGESVDSVACIWYRNFTSGLPAGEHHFEGRWSYLGVVFLQLEADVLFE